MGCCSCGYVEEKLLTNVPKSFPIEALNILFKQSQNGICKIIKEKSNGSGVFCLIPFPDKSNLLPVLMTNNHVLGKNDISQGNIIKFLLGNNKLSEIKINNSRKCYTNHQYDVTIIEIKKSDGLNSDKFLEIDDQIFEENLNKTYLLKTIYILHYPNGQNSEYSIGIIKGIEQKNHKIEHTCQTLPGSSGAPLINYINYKVLGIHKGAEKFKNWNLGSLLRLPIEEFIKEFGNKEDEKNDNISDEDEKSDNDFSLFSFNDLKTDSSKNEIKSGFNNELVNSANNAKINKNLNNAKNINNINNNSINNINNINSIKNINNNNKYYDKSKQVKNINEIENLENNEQNKVVEKNDEINKKNNNAYLNNFNNNNLEKENKIYYENINNIIDISNENLDNNEQLIKNQILNDDNSLDELTIIYSKANIKSSDYYFNLKFKLTSKETFSEDKLFGEQFVKDNKNKCKIIINGKEYNLSSYIKEEYNKDIFLLELKLKGVSKIRTMNNMFCGCISLTAIPDLGKINTKNIFFMNNIFCGCETLISLPDISTWNTSNVINMSHMFQYCLLLSSLPDISKWDTKSVKDMSYVFCMCESLSTLPDISKWNTSRVLSMFCMFSGCSSLKILPDISKWNTIYVQDMGFMFDSCEKLRYLPDISKWNTSNLRDTRYMFHKCSSLERLPDISKWDTSNIKETNNMFFRCKSTLNVPEQFKDCVIF